MEAQRVREAQVEALRKRNKEEQQKLITSASSEKTALKEMRLQGLMSQRKLKFKKETRF